MTNIINLDSQRNLREAHRRPDGRFGEQPRATSQLGILDSDPRAGAAPRPSIQPRAVLDTGTILGADGDGWSRPVLSHDPRMAETQQEEILQAIAARAEYFRSRDVPDDAFSIARDVGRFVPGVAGRPQSRGHGDDKGPPKDLFEWSCQLDDELKAVDPDEDGRPAAQRVQRMVDELIDAEWSANAPMDPAYTPPEPPMRTERGGIRGTTGTKHDSRRSLADTAKEARADVKAAVEAGWLPPGLNYAVRTRNGLALELEVEGLHEDWVYVRDDHGNRHLSGDAEELQRRLRAIGRQYQADHSDSMSDIFNTHPYVDVTIRGGGAKPDPGVERNWWQRRADEEAEERRGLRLSRLARGRRIIEKLKRSW